MGDHAGILGAVVFYHFPFGSHSPSGRFIDSPSPYFYSVYITYLRGSGYVVVRTLGDLHGVAWLGAIDLVTRG